MPEISIVIPVYNERESLPLLHSALRAALDGLGRSFEIIYVDDGSSDGSFEALAELAGGEREVKVIRFARNFGQTAAMAAGFKHARGKIIIPIDADLQNDPADIPLLLAELEKGYDVVSCWRRNRQDPLLTRKIPSLLANRLISLVSGVKLHDYGCTLKAYRREVLEGITLYGEMHRFIPIYAAWAGARVSEIPVRHHPRRYGRSNYNLTRTFKVLMDLITVKFLTSFSTKPMYFFGGAGSLLCAAGTLVAGAVLIEKYLYEVKAHRNPLLLLAVFLFMMGIQFILMGVVAELIIRTYYAAQKREPYVIKCIVNDESESLPQPGEGAKISMGSGIDN